MVEEYGNSVERDFTRIVKRNRLESEASETASLFSVEYLTDLELN